MVATGRKPAARRADLSARVESTGLQNSAKPRHAIAPIAPNRAGRIGKAAAGGMVAGAVLFSGMSLTTPEVAEAKPIGHGDNWPKLRKGDSGKKVVRLQRELSAYGPNVSATGYYGKRTKKLVKRLERRNDLKVNGITSGSVWHVLLTDGNKVKKKKKNDKWKVGRQQPRLTPGDEGKAVKKLQRELSAYGPNVPATGYYGKQTKKRVKRVQRRSDWKVTGVAGHRVWTKLLTDGNKPGGGGNGGGGNGGGGGGSNTVWDKLAQCESGGNWSINTGNGYYGGLQFSLSTWRAFGGSGMPHKKSRAEQIRIAKKVKKSQGWGAWPSCTSQLGLR